MKRTGRHVLSTSAQPSFLAIDFAVRARTPGAPRVLARIRPRTASSTDSTSCFVWTCSAVSAFLPALTFGLGQLLDLLEDALATDAARRQLGDDRAATARARVPRTRDAPRALRLPRPEA